MFKLIAQSKQHLSQEVLWILFCFSAINSLYISIAVAFNIASPTTFIFTSDLFGDFLKLTLSYPSASSITINEDLGLSHLLNEYLKNNPYNGARGLFEGVLTHFHMPPFTTLVILTSIKLMAVITPQLLLYLLFFTTLIITYLASRRVAHSTSDGFLWTACLLSSYPMLFALQRANFFSLASSLLIQYYIISIIKKENISLSCILFAIAVNMRPNLIFFLLALIILKKNQWKKTVAISLCSIGMVFVATINIDSMLYKDYNLDSFVKGLDLYKEIYVIAVAGDGFNSSLYAVLKFIFGYSKIIEPVGLIFSIIISVIAVFFYLRNVITSISFIFILCISSMCAFPIFADYHLLIFFLPLMLLSIIKKCERKYCLSDLAIYFSCILILAPKNYILVNGVSILGILNPLIGCVTTVLILCCAYIDFRKSKIFHL